MWLLIVALLALLAAVWALSVRRRARLPAEVEIVDPEGAPTIDADGAARSVQAAELRMPESALIALWSPASLERLARTYWRFLERSSLGLIRVTYSEHGRAIVLLCRPLVLIAFDAPQYELTEDHGVVRWRIRGGALVSHRQDRRGGFLAIDVRRLPDVKGGLGDPRRGGRAELLPGDRQRAGAAVVRGDAVGNPCVRDPRLPALARATRPGAVADGPLPRSAGSSVAAELRAVVARVNAPNRARARAHHQ